MEGENSCVRFWATTLADFEGPRLLPRQTAYHQTAPRATFELGVDGLQRPGDIDASTLMQAACTLLISQYSNSCDVVFGLHDQQATVPVRVRFAWDQTVAQIIQSIDLLALERHEFRYFGLDRIAAINESTTRASQFDILLVRVSPDSPTPCSDPSSSSHHALAISFSEHTEGLQLHVRFDTAAVVDSQARNLAFQLRHVVRQLCEVSRDVKLLNIETASPQDMKQIWAWNASVPPTIEACVHDLVARKATEQPGKIAVHAWDGTLTYEELMSKSDRLSLWLLHQDGLLAHERILPLCFEKTVWTTVTLLAIAKAGGAFIALDVDQPDSRLKAIVQDLQAPWILCTPRTMDKGRRLAPKVCVIDGDATVDEASAVYSCSIHNERKDGLHASRSGPHSTLYAVYTSGSTGDPKGLLISHANLCSAVQHQGHALGFGTRTRSFDYSSYSFDAYVFNTFYPLVHGGCVCVPSDTDRKGDIATAMRVLDVTFAQLTPSLARLITPDAVPALETLLLTGEKLSGTDLVPWLSRGVRVINAYGPSECTIMCAANADVVGSVDAANIGKGLGCVLWLCDLVNSARLAPLGAIGELLVEGPIVGQGYLGDARKTAATRVWDAPWLAKGPHGVGAPGTSRPLFRTGDLARYNSDGTLTFLGRADNQVKLHGQRIEPGEVEHNIRQLLPRKGGFNDCVIDVIQGTGSSSNSQELLCFLKLELGPQAVQGLVAHITMQLEKVLPLYMVPTLFLCVGHIPMTSSGKTDRRALRMMARAAPPDEFFRVHTAAADTNTGGGVCQEPRPLTTYEAVLQKLWVAILEPGPQESPIGPNDNFIQRGGSSMTAMKLIIGAQQEGYVLTVASIFGAPRLSDMALRMAPLERPLKYQELKDGQP